MEISSDTNIYFHDFAEPVRIDYGEVISGLWAETGKVLNQYTGEVETTQPTVLVLSGDYDRLQMGVDSTTTRLSTGVDYVVTGTDPDGKGLVLLQLTRADQ